MYPIVLCLAGLSVLSACSWFGDDDKSGLTAALDRVASSEDAKNRIVYGDTAGIVKLTGKAWGDEKGFAALRPVGVEQLAPYGEQVITDTGISLLDADYAIAVGGGQKALGLIVGGQKRDRVSSAMKKLGWHGSGDRMVGPDIGTVAGTTAGQYAIALGEVKADGSDVKYGQKGANLGDIGKPSGKTLADDKRVAALADCLGDVIAAEIDGAEGGTTRPSGVAVGVRRPENKGATPRGVVCTSWANTAGANRYATLAAEEMNTGKSTDGKPFAQVLQRTKVTKVGGDQNIVRWEADTPADALTVMQLLARGDIPGLPG